MSKLSRFKKAPAIKLRKPTSSKESQRSRSRFDEDSEDDDFVQRPESSSKIKQNEVTSSSSSTTTQSQVISSSSSVSEYFQSSKQKQKNSPTEIIQEVIQEMTDTEPEEKSSSASSEKLQLPVNPKIEEDVQQEVMDEESSGVSTSLKKQSEAQSKVVCPFCWKTLSDKLTGTTHVKSCAKNLPIQQVFEAMQLQEKQIKEWESLGLAFPGFAPGTNKQKNGPIPTRRRAAGGSRKKKGADADLELALALSASLHEEFESRKVKENQFIIENGLENEIGLEPVPKSGTKVLDEVKRTKPKPLEVPPAVRRRGKKIQLQELPLYSTSDAQKKAVIGERVAKILDESDKDNPQSFYIRNDLPPETVGIPKRLHAFHNKDATLWNLSRSSPETPEADFTVLELPEQTEGPIPSASRLSELGLEIQEPQPCLARSSKCLGNLHQHNSTVRNRAAPAVAIHTKLFSSGLSESHSCTINTTRGSSLDADVRTNDSLGNLPRVIQDVTRMLLRKTDYDITVYGREEKSIKCHRFMLQARCPKLLDEVIVEENPNKRRRHVIPLTSYTHAAVKAFVWYIYTGSIKSSYEEPLIIELKELSAAYELDIADNDTVNILKTRKCSAISVEVQTNAVRTSESSTMTDSEPASEEPIQKQGTLSSNDFHPTSQELFRTFDAGPSPDNIIPCCNEGAMQAAVDESLDDCNKSVDLFEDADYTEPKEDPQSSINNSTQCEMGCSRANRTLKTQSSDDEDYLKEIATPISQLVKEIVPEKKRSRSRSVSPLLGVSQIEFTATQVADIMQLRQEGGDLKGYIYQANKKQRLDYSDYDLEMLCKDDYEEEFHNDEMEVNNYNSDSETCYKSVDKSLETIHNIELSPSRYPSCLNTNNKTPTTNSSRLGRLSRSFSTPNLCVTPNNEMNPFSTQQVENDPLADTCDDSVFANINMPDGAYSTMRKASYVSAACKSSKSSLRQTYECSSQINGTPPSRSKRRVSPRNLSSFQDMSSDLPSQQSLVNDNTMKGRKKGKTKTTAPKIKLPSQLHSRRAVTQESIPTTKPPTPPAVHQTTGSNSNTSPLLNYSLIDTPILKQELKKYGIKPLPRSKAKVLLRHIYKETHK